MQGRSAARGRQGHVAPSLDDKICPYIANLTQRPWGGSYPKPYSRHCHRAPRRIAGGSRAPQGIPGGSREPLYTDEPESRMIRKSHKSNHGSELHERMERRKEDRQSKRQELLDLQAKYRVRQVNPHKMYFSLTYSEIKFFNPIFFFMES